MNLETNNTLHIPVMLSEILNYLAEDSMQDKLVVDCTFGAGGYSKAFLKRGANVIALDRDKVALEKGKELKKQFGDKLTLINTSFGRLEELDIEPPDVIVLDIGVSSMQIDQADRGFSFQKDGPLDMRMGGTIQTAADVVNTYSIEALTQIFRYYGEESHAKKIAIMIVRSRQQKLFSTTMELSKSIESLLPKRHFEKIHPATRVFQALRIYINDELTQLNKVLLAAERILPKGGKIGVVSFHSLEDKIVKKFLLNRSQAKAVSRYLPEIQNYCPSFLLPHKKAIMPLETECLQNKRARSAKFRYAIRNDAPPIKAQETLYKTLKFN